MNFSEPVFRLMLARPRDVAYVPKIFQHYTCVCEAFSSTQLLAIAQSLASVGILVTRTRRTAMSCNPRGRRASVQALEGFSVCEKGYQSSFQALEVTCTFDVFRLTFPHWHVEDFRGIGMLLGTQGPLQAHIMPFFRNTLQMYVNVTQIALCILTGFVVVLKVYGQEICI